MHTLAQMEGFYSDNGACVQERMGRALVVNAPSFFNVLWRIVQPLIPAQTKKRLVVLKSMEVHTAVYSCLDHVLCCDVVLVTNALPLLVISVLRQVLCMLVLHFMAE